MPHTPLEAEVSHLNNQYAYVLDTTRPFSYSPLYLQDNYLEKYLERANCVIDFLMKQKWVSQNDIVVFGHSQGARIATMLAKENLNISALGYFSADPDGRFSQLIKLERRAAEQGHISEEKAQENINQ